MIRTVIVSAAVVLSGLFAVEIHRLATAPVWTPPVAAAADPTEPAAAPDMLRAPALDRMALSVISERPLFSPSRRPERPARPAPAPAAPDVRATVQLSLTGVSVSSAGRQAIVRVGQAAQQRVRVGDEIGGWRLDEITSDGVRLTRGPETAELTLGETRQLGAAATARPAASGAAPRRGPVSGFDPLSDMSDAMDALEE